MEKFEFVPILDKKKPWKSKRNTKFTDTMQISVNNNGIPCESPSEDDYDEDITTEERYNHYNSS